MNAYFYTSACYLNAGTTVVYNEENLVKSLDLDLQGSYGFNKFQDLPLGNPFRTELQCADVVWTSRVLVQNFFEFYRIANDDPTRLPPFVLNGMISQYWGYPSASADMEHCFLPIITFNPFGQWLNPSLNSGNTAYNYGGGPLRTNNGLQFLLRNMPFQMVIGATGTVSVSVFQVGPVPRWVEWAQGSIECPLDPSDPICHTPGTNFSIQLNVMEQFCGAYDVANKYDKVLGSSVGSSFYGVIFPKLKVLFSQALFLRPAHWLQQVVPLPDANSKVTKGLTTFSRATTICNTFSPQLLVCQLNNTISQAPGIQSTTIPN
jgi:hypothetical protein